MSVGATSSSLSSSSSSSSSSLSSASIPAIGDHDRASELVQSRLLYEATGKRAKAFVYEIKQKEMDLGFPAALYERIRAIHIHDKIYVLVPTRHGLPCCQELSRWLFSRAGKKEIAVHTEGMVRDPKVEKMTVERTIKPMSALFGVDQETDGYLFGMEDPGFPEYLLFGNNFLKCQDPLKYAQTLNEFTSKLKYSFIDEACKIWEQFEKAPSGKLNQLYRSCEFPKGAPAHERVLIFIVKIQHDQKMIVELFRQLTSLALERLPFSAKKKKELTQLFLKNANVEQAWAAYLGHSQFRNPIILKNIFNAPVPPGVIHVIPIGRAHRDALSELIIEKLKLEAR